MRQAILKAAEKFKSEKGPIRIVSHFDSDGLSAAALMTKLMQLEDISFQLTIVKHLDETIIKELSLEEYKTYVFTDLGSGQADLIEKYLGDRSIYILDHHRPKDIKNAQHINPHLFGIDNEKEISGAGVTFLFSREVNQDMDHYAHIAIIGAMGDVQEKDGFIGLNKEILQIAVKNKTLVIKQDLKLYGSGGRSIVKILQFSNDIKGLSNNKDAVFSYLRSINISPHKKLYELTEKEKKTIADELIKRGKPKNRVIGPIYILPNEKQNSPFYDIREFSTLLNACGRLEQNALGIGALLNDNKSKELALQALAQYREDLQAAIAWFNNNKKTSTDITENNKYVIINAKDKILPNIVGTLASIISKSSKYPYNFIITLSQYTTGKTKISIRLGKGITTNLLDLAKRVFADIKDSAYGGHSNAVGANIDSADEPQFIDNLIKELEKI